MKIIPASIRYRFAEKPELNRILENIFWLFFDKGVRILVALIVTLWMARYLGPKQFGQLNFAIAFVSIFTAIATLGLNSIVVRDLVRHADDRGEILGTAFLLQTIGSITVIVITILTITFLRPEDATGKLLVAIISFGTIFQSTLVIKYWFESQVQTRYVVWVENLVFLIMSMLRIGFIVIKAPLIAFAIIIFFEALISSIGLILIYLRICGPINRFWILSIVRAKSLLKESWPLLLSSIAILLYMRIDQIMLGEMIGDEAVGIYSAALRLSEIWYMIPTVVTASFFPEIIKLKQRDEKNYNEKVILLLSYTLAIAVMIAVIFTFSADILIKILFGADFDQSAAVLMVHIWSAPFVFMGVVGSSWVLVENQQLLGAIRAIIGAAINVLLNFLLIPAYGPIGAAISTLISYCMLNYILDAVLETTRPLFLMKSKAFYLAPLKSYKFIQTKYFLKRSDNL